MSEAAAPRTRCRRTVTLTKITGRRARETDEEKAKRLSELKASGVQPVKQDYICKAPPEDSGSQRGQKKNAPSRRWSPRRMKC